MDKENLRILFICLGNICRSPLAAGLMRHKLRHAGISQIIVSSAALGPWHVGEGADPRSISTAAKHGIDISDHRVKQVSVQKLLENDLVVGMDQENYRQLIHLAQTAFPDDLHKTSLLKQKIYSVRDFEDITEQNLYTFMNTAISRKPNIVPDPYYGTIADFEKAYQILDHTLNGLLLYSVSLLATPRS